MNSESLFSSSAAYLLCTSADLDGVGNQPSSFLSGDSDDIFQRQCNLYKKVKNCTRLSEQAIKQLLWSYFVMTSLLTLRNLQEEA